MITLLAIAAVILGFLVTAPIAYYLRKNKKVLAGGVDKTDIILGIGVGIGIAGLFVYPLLPFFGLGVTLAATVFYLLEN